MGTRGEGREKLLTEGIDYTVSYGADDFTNVAGVIKVTVTGQATTPAASSARTASRPRR